jgi:two-component sensor histidine kinase
LPGNLINSVREDENGYIWIASDKGLSKLDRGKNIFTNYSKRNGLNEFEFTLNLSAKAKDGTLYFGCRNGLLYFHPDSIKDESVSAPLVFTDFKIFNQSVPISTDGSTILSESITGIKTLEIPHKASVITLEFALLDYFNVKRNNFSYKLVGFDTEWNDVGGRNSATYTNLPPGEYNFIVRATNNVGIKDGIEASIKIIVEPAFYQTWIFRIVSTAFILGAAFLILHMRTKKITQRNKDLEEKVNERTKDLDKTIKELSQEIIIRKNAEENVQKSLEEKEMLLKEIHHRVKNNLQVISSLLYLQSVSLKDDEAVNLFKDSQDRIRCMALIHEKLYQSKDLAGISFKEYVKSLVDDLERSYKKQNVPVVTKINIGDIKLSLDTAMPCGLMVNEMMTNAYKYAFPIDWAKQKLDDFEFSVWISVEELGQNKYILEFSDNGIGIPEEFDIMNAESLGMKLINSLVIQLNGSLEIKRNNGTHFKIEFEDLI